MAGKATITYADYSNETGQVRINTEDVTPANLADVQTELTALRAAINGIAGGALRNRTLSIITPQFTAPPSDPAFQRELKWVVSWRVNDGGAPDFGKAGTSQVPCARVDLLSGGDDVLWTINQDQTNVPAAVTDFITAFETVARSSIGSAIQVLAIELAGRNL